MPDIGDAFSGIGDTFGGILGGAGKVASAAAPFIGPAATLAGLGFAGSQGVQNPFSAFGVPDSAFAPVTSRNVSTPNYNLSQSRDGSGTLNTTLGVNDSPVVSDWFNKTLPDYMSALGQFGQTAETYGMDFRNSFDAAQKQFEASLTGDSALAPVNRLNDARLAGLSTLKDGLARRGVLGSSFANDAMSRADSEYQRALGDTRYALANNLVKQQQGAATARQTGAMAWLDQVKSIYQTQSALVGQALAKQAGEIGLAAGQSTTMTDALNQNARFLQQLAATEAAGRGQLFATGGQLAGNAIGQLSGAAGNLFTSAGGALSGGGSSAGGLLDSFNFFPGLGGSAAGGGAGGFMTGASGAFDTGAAGWGLGEGLGSLAEFLPFLLV